MVWFGVNKPYSQCVCIVEIKLNTTDINSVFYAYILLTPTECTLYVNESCLEPSESTELTGSITVKPYDTV